MNAVEKKTDSEFSERLNTSGFRFTPQRQHVYDVLLQRRDHPTAEEVFIRAKRTMPDISMATVYNCLDALVKCGLPAAGATGARRDALLPEHARSTAIIVATHAAVFLTWICRRRPPSGRAAAGLPG